MNPIEIKLPFEHGKYILNDQAVIAIQHASYLELSFKSVNGVPVEGECWLRVGTRVVEPLADPADEVYYQMPVNVTHIDLEEADWEVSHKEICGGHVKSALQVLVEAGTHIDFLPDYDTGTGDLSTHGFCLDTIYWFMRGAEHTVQDIFGKEVRPKYDRLVKKNLRDEEA